MQEGQVKARFEINGYSRPGGYEGFHDPNQRWNGWATPRFTLEAAKQIAEDTQKLAQDNPESDVVTMDGNIGPDEPAAFLIASGAAPDEPAEYVFADEDGLYGIGAFAWVWEVVGE